MVYSKRLLNSLYFYKWPTYNDLTAQESYFRHIHAYANKDVYFWDEIKQHMLDDDGNLCRLDDNIFKLLKLYVDKVKQIYDEAMLVLQKHSDEIARGYELGHISEGVLMLDTSSLYACTMHESWVKFEIDAPYITTHFGPALNFPPMRCRFYVAPGENFRVFDSEINLSEVTINSDGTFQYSALVWKDGCNDMQEIYIKFSDVDVEILEHPDFKDFPDYKTFRHNMLQHKLLMR